MTRNPPTPLRAVTSWIVLALASASCGGEPQPPVEEVGACEVTLPVDRVPGATPIELVGLELTDADTPQLTVRGGPMDGAALDGVVFLSDPSSLRFFAPVTPATMDATHTYELTLTRAAGTCSLGELTVEPLPEPGAVTVDTVLADASALAQTVRELYGATPEALEAASPEDREVLSLVAGLAAALDPDDPDALPAMLRSELTEQDRVFYARAFAALPRPQTRTQELRGLLGECDTRPPAIQTAEQLSCWVNVQTNLELFFQADEVKFLRATIGMAIGVGGLVTGGAGWATFGAVNFSVNLLIDLLDAMLPSKLERLELTTPEALCPEEMVFYPPPELLATNKGYSLTIFTVVDGLGAAIGLSGLGTTTVAGASKKLLEGRNLSPAKLEAFAERVLSVVRDLLINYTGFVLPEVTGAITPPLGKRTWQVTLPEDLYLVTTTGDVAVDAQNLSIQSRASAQGDATVTFETAGSAFGGKTIKESRAIRLDEARVEVVPVLERAGTVVTLETIPFCLPEDYAVFWTSRGRDGGQLLDPDAGTYRTPDPSSGEGDYPSELTATVVRPGTHPDTPYIGDVTVRTCCASTPPLSCTLEERCMCEEPPQECTGDFTISPETACATAGQEIDFRVTSGAPLGPPEVTWAASDGMIDAEGLFTAPGTLGDVTITAREVDGEREATHTLTVAQSCGCSGGFDVAGISFSSEGIDPGRPFGKFEANQPFEDLFKTRVLVQSQNDGGAQVAMSVTTPSLVMGPGSYPATVDVLLLAVDSANDEIYASPEFYRRDGPPSGSLNVDSITQVGEDRVVTGTVNAAVTAGEDGPSAIVTGRFTLPFNDFTLTEDGSMRLYPAPRWSDVCDP